MKSWHRLLTILPSLKCSYICGLKKTNFFVKLYRYFDRHLLFGDQKNVEHIKFHISIERAFSQPELESYMCLTLYFAWNTVRFIWSGSQDVVFIRYALDSEQYPTHLHCNKKLLLSWILYDWITCWIPFYEFCARKNMRKALVDILKKVKSVLHCYWSCFTQTNRKTTAALHLEWKEEKKQTRKVLVGSWIIHCLLLDNFHKRFDYRIRNLGSRMKERCSVLKKNMDWHGKSEGIWCRINF